MFPRHLTRYQILQPLGQGGMSRVYLAHDTLLDRPVAVKVLPGGELATPGDLHRFRGEALTLARLSHPNIVNILEFNESEGVPYLVMDYLPGGSLESKLGRPLPWQAASRLLLPIAEALEAAHHKDIIHRDVKPSNLLLSEAGQLVLSDFGIARACQPGESQASTISVLSAGTPQYMSPEQSLGKPVDGRTDVYSLGVVFYELVTGRKPFDGDTPLAVLVRQTRKPLGSPRRWVRSLPPAVEELLRKALAPEPEDRFASMQEFRLAMGALADGNQGAHRRGDPSELRLGDTLVAGSMDSSGSPRRWGRLAFPRRWIVWVMGILLAAYLAGYAWGSILTLLDTVLRPRLAPFFGFPM